MEHKLETRTDMEIPVITLIPPDDLRRNKIEIVNNLWMNKVTILYFIAVLLLVVFACVQAIIA